MTHKNINFLNIIFTFIFIISFISCNDDKKTSLPLFSTSPSDSVRIDKVYSYDFICEDADSESLIVSKGEDDSCNSGINLAIDGLGSGNYTFTASEVSDATCLLQISCSDGSHTTVQEQIITINPIPDIEELEFFTFDEFATPIEDFITLNASKLGNMNFRKSISELIVYHDNLYLGYGDADLNLGRNSPIEVRYFMTPDSTMVSSDFATDEEEISRYRILDGNLFIPGVDATEDDLLGNVYSFSGESDWYKSRTLQFAWHVHDVAFYKNAFYAVGSGGTIDDYNNSTVNAFLWISEDSGKNFSIDQQIPHPAPPGDNRFTSLLSLENMMYVFGYYSSEGTTFSTTYTLDDSGFNTVEGTNFFVTDTYKLSSDKGIAVGVIIGSPLKWGVKYVTATGFEPVDSLSDVTVYDIYPMSQGRALILYVDGNEYPEPVKSSYGIKVGLLSENGTLTRLIYQFLPDRPKSIALWRDCIYMGSEKGEILRATPVN